MQSLKEILTLSEQYLSHLGVEKPRFSAEEIIAHVLGCKRLDLYLSFEKPLLTTEIEQIREMIRKRGSKMPLAYLWGYVDFYQCRIAVNSQVLIPRVETEILLDLVCKELEKIPSLKNMILWDLCTGSGCMAIAIKKRFSDLTVIGSDISSEALNVAEQNAASNGVKIEWRQGDFLSCFQNKKADFILTNPPYVSSEEYLHLSQEVTAFEPKSALVAENGGLFFYEQLAHLGHLHLNPKGRLFLEIGKDQGEKVKNLFSVFPQIKKSFLLQDWAGHDRFFFLEIE